MATHDSRYMPNAGTGPEPTELPMDNAGERPKGARVIVPTEENAFLSDRTLVDLIDPKNTNSARLTDIYQLREDDFEPPSELEVWYMDKGKPKKEYMFIDPLHSMEQPRICVSVKAVQAMHRAIAVLTRKTDNMLLTLRSCRQNYYKELMLLRELVHRQNTGKDMVTHADGTTEYIDHLSMFYNPNSYQDEVTVKMCQERIFEATNDLEQKLQMKNGEIRKLHMKINKIETGIDAFDRVEAKDMEDQIHDLTAQVEQLTEERDEKDQRLEEAEDRIAALRSTIVDKQEVIELTRELIDKKDEKHKKMTQREYERVTTLEHRIYEERTASDLRLETQRQKFEAEKQNLLNQISQLQDHLSAARQAEDKARKQLNRQITKDRLSSVRRRSSSESGLLSHARKFDSEPPTLANFGIDQDAEADHGPAAGRMSSASMLSGRGTPFGHTLTDQDKRVMRMERMSSLKDDVKEYLAEKRKTVSDEEGLGTLNELCAMEATISEMENKEDLSHLSEQEREELELAEIERLWAQVYKKPPPMLDYIPETPRRATVMDSAEVVDYGIDDDLQHDDENVAADLQQPLLDCARDLGETAPEACLDAVYALIGYMTPDDRRELQDFIGSFDLRRGSSQDKLATLRPDASNAGTSSRSNSQLSRRSSKQQRRGSKLRKKMPRRRGSTGSMITSSDNNAAGEESNQENNGSNVELEKRDEANVTAENAPAAALDNEDPKGEALAQLSEGAAGKVDSPEASPRRSSLGGARSSTSLLRLDEPGSPQSSLFASFGSRTSGRTPNLTGTVGKDMRLDAMGLEVAGSQVLEPPARRLSQEASRAPSPDVPVEDLLAKWGAGIPSLPTTAPSEETGPLDSRDSNNLASVGSLDNAAVTDANLDVIDSTLQTSTGQQSPARIAALLNDSYVLEMLGPARRLARSLSDGQLRREVEQVWDGASTPLLSADEARALRRRRSLPPMAFQGELLSRQLNRQLSQKAEQGSRIRREFVQQRRRPSRRRSLLPCWSAPMNVDVGEHAGGTGLSRLTLSHRELPLRHQQVASDLMSSGWTLTDPSGECYPIDGSSEARRQTQMTARAGAAPRRRTRGMSFAISRQSVHRPSLYWGLAGQGDDSQESSGAELSLVGHGLAGPTSNTMGKVETPRTALHGIHGTPRFRGNPSGGGFGAVRDRQAVAKRTAASRALGMLNRANTEYSAFSSDTDVIVEGHHIEADISAEKRADMKSRTSLFSPLPSMDAHWDGTKSLPTPTGGFFKTRSTRADRTSVSFAEFGFNGISPAATAQSPMKKIQIMPKVIKTSEGVQTTISVANGANFELLVDQEQFPWRETASTIEKEFLRTRIAQELIKLCCELRSFAGLDGFSSSSKEAVDEFKERKRKSAARSSKIDIGTDLGIGSEHASDSPNLQPSPKAQTLPSLKGTANNASLERPRFRKGHTAIQTLSLFPRSPEENEQRDSARRTPRRTNRGATSPILENESDSERLARISRALNAAKPTEGIGDVCDCGETFLGDTLFCRRCGSRRPLKVISQGMCSCGALMRPEALFCRKCGATRAHGDGIRRTMPAFTGTPSASSLAHSDGFEDAGEKPGSQASLSTAASASSFKGAGKFGKHPDGLHGAGSSIDEIEGRSLGVAGKARTVKQDVAVDMDFTEDDLPGAVQAAFMGPALSAKSLIKTESVKSVRHSKVSLNPLGKPQRQLENFECILDAIAADASGSTAAGAHKVTADDSIVERSRRFLDHERRMSGGAPLSPRSPDRPQTQRQSRNKLASQSVFAEQDLTKWYPETAREGNSALPLKALLSKP